jgi:uncharacterized protein with ATP-grasp and redox domains
MDDQKIQHKIVVSIQETAVFRDMCKLLNEMFNDKRIPNDYKTRITQLVKKGFK